MNKNFQKAISSLARKLEKHRQRAAQERDPHKRQMHEEHHAAALKKLLRLLQLRGYGSNVVVTLYLIFHDLYGDQDRYYDRIMCTI